MRKTMNSYLLKNLSGITSASIEKYLLFTGWEKDDTFRNPRMWVFKSKHDSATSSKVKRYFTIFAFLSYNPKL